MKKEKIPDLRKLLVGLMDTIKFTNPKVVDDSHIKRVQEASNVLLVSTRVLISICKNANLITSEDVTRLVESANSSSLSPEQALSSKSEPAKVTGRVTDWEVLQSIDTIMADPELRVKMPDWFLADLWPATLKRVALGQRMTDREREITMYVASTIRGER
jgi:hypothetical protein